MTGPLHNYLRTCRRRVGLSQDEIAVLLGIRDGSHVGRHESAERLPSLETTLAYEFIFGLAAKELFAGLYRRVEVDVRSRARQLLSQVQQGPETPRQAAKVELLAALTEREVLLAVPAWGEE